MNRVRRVWGLLFNKRLAWALLWTALITAVAISVNLIGVHVVGDVNDWSQWLKEHGGCFLAWRLCVYGATAYGWLRMRRRLIRRETGADTPRRLLRTEIAAVLAVIALEGTAALQSR